MKWCKNCSQHLKLSEFGTNAALPDGLSRHCRACTNSIRRDHRKSNPHLNQAAKNRWAERYPEKHLASSKRRYDAYRERAGELRRARDKAIKDAVFLAYGGYLCACCWESEPSFLVIDHIEGTGASHRRDIKGSGSVTYRWLRDNVFPPGFQVLCHNCNWGKAHNNNVCPHQDKKRSVAS